jgi:dihydropteroate synthase
LGVHDVIIDPGFGFAKTAEHNYQLMSRLQEFDRWVCLYWQAYPAKK